MFGKAIKKSNKLFPYCIYCKRKAVYLFILSWQPFIHIFRLDAKDDLLKAKIIEIEELKKEKEKYLSRYDMAEVMCENTLFRSILGWLGVVGWCDGAG